MGSAKSWRGKPGKNAPPVRRRRPLLHGRRRQWRGRRPAHASIRGSSRPQGGFGVRTARVRATRRRSVASRYGTSSGNALSARVCSPGAAAARHVNRVAASVEDVAPFGTARGGTRVRGALEVAVKHATGSESWLQTLKERLTRTECGIEARRRPGRSRGRLCGVHVSPFLELLSVRRPKTALNPAWLLSLVFKPQI